VQRRFSTRDLGLTVRMVSVLVGIAGLGAAIVS
jgi:hypothetical protein